MFSKCGSCVIFGDEGKLHLAEGLARKFKTGSIVLSSHQVFDLTGEQRAEHFTEIHPRCFCILSIPEHDIFISSCSRLEINDLFSKMERKKRREEKALEKQRDKKVIAFKAKKK
jgi:hypothetical protein